MGLDAEIFFRCKTAVAPRLEDPLLPGFEIRPISEWSKDDVPEATHEVDCGCSRYYGPHYERGPWPLIAATLMELLASEDVEKVWYGSDSGPALEMDAEAVNEISAHYMKNGQRPYRRR